ncbi:MAG: hypothetical protein JKY65_13855 [Planctomycetes bacterium]|nr:hypothetical protein [Planctomycetota bacterium]
MPFRSLCEATLAATEDTLAGVETEDGAATRAQSVVRERDTHLEYGPAYKATTLVFYAGMFPTWLRDPEPDVLFRRALLVSLRSGVADRSYMECLARDVGPWLSGVSDPVRERVEARQREGVGE